MARMTANLNLKIQDLESFKRLIEALGAWADEAKSRHNMTEAEAELFAAAVEIAEGHN